MTTPPDVPTCVAVLIAAPASGQGETTVTAALARWHTRQGRRVRVFKCGPDYLDPYWHQLASGATVHNLDGWMVGMPEVRARLHAAAAQADVILIEGVMGLFDGSPTAADLAAQLGIPVVLVMDASAMAGSFGAVVLGMQQYQPDVPWAGVLANRVGSGMHAQMLQASLRDPAVWLGALQRIGEGKDAQLLPERHLGLVAAHELPDAMARLNAAADALADTPLGQIPWEDWQRWSVEFALDASAPTPQIEPWLQGRTVAVASDAAFSFIYPANLDCLQAMGAKLVFFSPLAAGRLPACDAVWLPGGYPELHAHKLAANTGLQADLRAHVQAGKAVWAECGGMLALGDSITGGRRGFAHVGHFAGHCVYAAAFGRAGHAGMCAARRPTARPYLHYSRFDCAAAEVARTSRAGQSVQADKGEAVYQHGSVCASYFHAWFPIAPPRDCRLAGRRGGAMGRCGCNGIIYGTYESDEPPCHAALARIDFGRPKSGKTRRAEQAARDWVDAGAGRYAVYLATGQAWDAEMQARIARHQADRALRVPGMQTVEAPLHLGQALQAHSKAQTWSWSIA